MDKPCLSQTRLSRCVRNSPIHRGLPCNPGVFISSDPVRSSQDECHPSSQAWSRQAHLEHSSQFTGAQAFFNEGTVTLCRIVGDHSLGCHWFALAVILLLLPITRILSFSSKDKVFIPTRVFTNRAEILRANISISSTHTLILSGSSLVIVVIIPNSYNSSRRVSAILRAILALANSTPSMQPAGLETRDFCDSRSI